MVFLHISFDLDADIYGDGKKLDADMVASTFPIEMAEEMAKLPGLIWKLWTSQAEECKADGFYLFSTREDAENRAAFAKKAFPRAPGLSNVKTEIHDVMEDLSRVTRAPIDLPANPSL